jgi:hypothetical protein
MTRLLGEMGERERDELLRFANYLRHSNRHRRA